jgi:hypothetical protein
MMHCVLGLREKRVQKRAKKEGLREKKGAKTCKERTRFFIHMHRVSGS